MMWKALAERQKKDLGDCCSTLKDKEDGDDTGMVYIKAKMKDLEKKDTCCGLPSHPPSYISVLEQLN